MSDFTETDRERMAKWCEHPDGSVPCNAICRLFDSHEKLRATASRQRAWIDATMKLPTYAHAVWHPTSSMPAELTQHAARVEEATSKGLHAMPLITRPYPFEDKP